MDDASRCATVVFERELGDKLFERRDAWNDVHVGSHRFLKSGVLAAIDLKWNFRARHATARPLNLSRQLVERILSRRGARRRGEDEHGAEGCQKSDHLKVVETHPGRSKPGSGAADHASMFRWARAHASYTKKEVVLVIFSLTVSPSETTLSSVMKLTKTNPSTSGGTPQADRIIEAGIVVELLLVDLVITGCGSPTL